MAVGAGAGKHAPSCLTLLLLLLATDVASFSELKAAIHDATEQANLLVTANMHVTEGTGGF